MTIGAVVYDDFGGAQPSDRRRVGPSLEPQGPGSQADCGERRGPALMQPWALGGLDSDASESHANGFARHMILVTVHAIRWLW